MVSSQDFSQSIKQVIMWLCKVRTVGWLRQYCPQVFSRRSTTSGILLWDELDEDKQSDFLVCQYGGSKFTVVLVQCKCDNSSICHEVLLLLFHLLKSAVHIVELYPNAQLLYCTRGATVREWKSSSRFQWAWTAPLFVVATAHQYAICRIL